MTTGYLYHEMFGWYDPGSAAGLFPPDPRQGVQPLWHFEHPDTKRRIHELVVVSGLIEELVRLSPRQATVREIERVHEREHIDRVRADSDRAGGDAGDGISPFGRGGYEIAALAAGAVLEGVDAVFDGRVDNAYALVRPPGHHALPGSGMGFCVFNNIAIAARHAQRVHGVRRIAVLDWDVHHGNGTQAVFYEDPDVLAISMHQDNVFPLDSGGVDETGAGAGEGSTVNLPLPPGTGDGGYEYAMRTVCLPAIRRFQPELLLVACGFDAGAMDPLGRQMVTSDGFRTLTELAMRVAGEVCEGRLVLSHEGGYNPAYVPFSGLAVLETLSGKRTVPDPFLPLVSAMARQDLQPAQRAAVDGVASAAELGEPVRG